MASPILSRSPSMTFAPGPHRRSHPNLHHLSLVPLTPKYPIVPADYDAYVDPSTSELHSSASLSHIAALPSPGGILTNSPARSRASSRTRLRKKAKSSVAINVPFKDVSDEIDNDDDTETLDHKPAGKSRRSQQHLPRLRTNPVVDSNWLVQTGLTLSESSRESKGQSWISKRDSSTFLANTPIDSSTHAHFYPDPRLEGRTPRSGRATPARSRVGSRNTSRNASRSRPNLSMTMTGAMTVIPGASFATAPDTNTGIREEEEEQPESSYSHIEPEWADARTQAEIAAQVQAEFGEEYDYDNGDPFGILDFDRRGGDDSESSDAEEEVKKAMTRYGIGGWMDGAIDALLRIEEENDTRQERNDIERGNTKRSEAVGFDNVETPPESEQGQWRIWNDVAWFGRMVRRSVNEG